MGEKVSCCFCKFYNLSVAQNGKSSCFFIPAYFSSPGFGDGSHWYSHSAIYNKGLDVREIVSRPFKNTGMLPFSCVSIGARYTPVSGIIIIRLFQWSATKSVSLAKPPPQVRQNLLYQLHQILSCNPRSCRGENSGIQINTTDQMII